MKKYSLKEFFFYLDFFLEQANKEKIFVYPTDSIYGIGTIYNTINMMKINKIKQRPTNKICSIIAPNIEWIYKNYNITSLKFENKNIKIEKLKDLKELISKTQNKYNNCTYIFDKNKAGVRLINHKFQEFVKILNKPFITTSVNLNKKKHIYNLKQIPQEIENYVDFAIDDGEKKSNPSVIINFVNGTILNR